MSTVTSPIMSVADNYHCPNYFNVIWMTISQHNLVILHNRCPNISFFNEKKTQ